MRHNVVQEGIDLVHWFIEPGGLISAEEELDIIYGFSQHVDTRLGKARDMQRDDEGHISFDLQFDDPMWEKWIKDEMFEVTVYAHRLEAKQEILEKWPFRRLYVTHATIRQISIVPVEMNPMSLKENK